MHLFILKDENDFVQKLCASGWYSKGFHPFKKNSKSLLNVPLSFVLLLPKSSLFSLTRFFFISNCIFGFRLELLRKIEIWASKLLSGCFCIFVFSYVFLPFLHFLYKTSQFWPFEPQQLLSNCLIFWQIRASNLSNWVVYKKMCTKDKNLWLCQFFPLWIRLLSYYTFFL